MSAVLLGKTPEHPVILQTLLPLSTCISIPQASKAINKASLSSLNNMPCKIDVPSAIAASSKARLVILLEPGTVTMALTE
jgi:starvation-inducible outer membrane lipoprotein